MIRIQLPSCCCSAQRSPAPPAPLRPCLHCPLAAGPTPSETRRRRRGESPPQGELLKGNMEFRIAQNSYFLPRLAIRPPYTAGSMAAARPEAAMLRLARCRPAATGPAATLFLVRRRRTRRRLARRRRFASPGGGLPGWASQRRLGRQGDAKRRRRMNRLRGERNRSGAAGRSELERGLPSERRASRRRMMQGEAAACGLVPGDARTLAGAQQQRRCWATPGQAKRRLTRSFLSESSPSSFMLL